jgi:uncharacterized protein (TIGR03437 family)
MNRALVALVLSAFVGTALYLQTPNTPDARSLSKRKNWDQEKRAREAWLWHEINVQQRSLGRFARADAVSIDINDIAVIQGDSDVFTQRNLFDLNGRSVQFTPSGAGYTVTSSIGGFDAALGTKLDLTVAPAVNPNPGTQPGDDAYLLTNLGFSFSFYSTSFTQAAISSNGFLTFRPAGTADDFFNADSVNSGESLFDLQTKLPRIAPYWHDLDARAGQTPGGNGIFLRLASDRAVVTWNNIRDFPNDETVDTGVHRFQVTLFSDGRILFAYDTVQLTTKALAGVSAGGSSPIPRLVDLSNPTTDTITAPIAEFFSTTQVVDFMRVIQIFYAAHPGQDVYDFLYLFSDFNLELGDAFAFYAPLRNDTQGIGLEVFDDDPGGDLGSRRIQGLLTLGNINGAYPDSPTTRFLGANNALSVMAQEQGHRWLAYPGYPGVNPLQLLGRDDAHWSFFYNIESSVSSLAAPRSSSAEGNVWRDNGDGSFTSINLIDGYSRLDHYLMGLRPASDVAETFVITDLTSTGGLNRSSAPRPNVTVRGRKQPVTIGEIVQANGSRNPSAANAPHNFRAAVVLLVNGNVMPSEATLSKVTRFRLAWESYFAQATDYIAKLNTGLAEETITRFVAALDAAAFKPVIAPSAIGALFGAGLTSGNTEVAASLPLPTELAGTQLRVNSVAAGLFFASPGQINFEVPPSTLATTSVFSGNVPSSLAFVEVLSNGQLIRAGTFPIAPVVPAVFTVNQSGSGPAAALDAFDFSGQPFAATRPNGQPNAIAVFGNGLGADATGSGGNVAGSVQATISGSPATVLYAGPAPGFTGLNQVNVQFFGGLSAGTHNLVITRNGIPSNTTTIAIR